MVHDITFFFEMDVTLVINLVLKLCGMMAQAMIVMVLCKLSLSERLNYDIAMDVLADSVSGVCIDWIRYLHVKEGLLVQHFVLGIIVARLKSVVSVDMVIRMRFGVIVGVMDHMLLMVRRVNIMIVVLIVLWMSGQSSNDLSTVVRHCIVTLHPNSMRCLMYFLAEVVLFERVIEMIVVLAPELGV